MNKVYGGTPVGNTSLCATCRKATIVEGENLQKVVRCCALESLIIFPVFKCSDYDDKRMPSKYEMEQIAWRIESRVRGPVGFSEGDTGPSNMEVVISPPKKRDYPE